MICSICDLSGGFGSHETSPINLAPYWENAASNAQSITVKRTQITSIAAYSVNTCPAVPRRFFLLPVRFIFPQHRRGGTPLVSCYSVQRQDFASFASGDHLILLIQDNDIRKMFLCLLRRETGERHNCHNISHIAFMRRRAVQAKHPGTAFSWNRIGFKTLPVCSVDDQNFS